MANIKYDVDPERRWPHHFEFDDQNMHQKALHWCAETWGQDVSALRWDYVRDKRLIKLRQADHALQFWIRWAT